MFKGLYIHIPFCMKKCRYCDFISFTSGDKKAYTKALMHEMSKYKGEYIDTVFVGGGTPTVLENDDLSELFTFVDKNFNLKSEFEWTVEANPKTFDREKLNVMKSAGVNRISVGVQSFDDHELDIIGRIHNSYEAEKAICLVGEMFDNFNADIMFGLPGQTAFSYENTIKRLLGYNPSHISCYSLILEDNTELYKMNEDGVLSFPDEETERGMYEYTKSILSQKGYNHYEISNFAKKGKECRHNIKYWKCDEYIGVGLAAHSYFNGTRYANTSCMKSYIDGKTLEDSISLSQKDMKSEFIIMSLRLAEGINCAEYKKRFGEDFYEEFKDVTDKFTGYGLMEKVGEAIRLTDKGISVSNSIMCEFV